MKRFYKDVSVAEVEGLASGQLPAGQAPSGKAWRVLLDGRSIKTAAGAQQIVPTRALAEALAQEWAIQGETLNIAFPLRDLADYAIDAIAPGHDDAAASLLPYAETDTLCYRADPDEPLHRRQLEVWEPILVDVEARFDVQFTRVSGIVHKPQPPRTLERLYAELACQAPFTLAALRMLASLSASLSIALLAIQPGADIAGLWEAAGLEEEWQAELWGRDEEAEQRREQRLAAFALAARFAVLSRTA